MLDKDDEIQPKIREALEQYGKFVAYEALVGAKCPVTEIEKNPDTGKWIVTTLRRVLWTSFPNWNTDSMTKTNRQETSKKLQVALDAPADVVHKGGWELFFQLDLDDIREPEPLLDVPGAITVALRFAGTDPALATLDDRFGNYLRFPLPDGSCPVLECALPGSTPIGLPLGAFPNPRGTHKIVVRRADDARWSVTADGIVHDENGLKDRAISWPDSPAPGLVSPRVRDLRFVAPAPPSLPQPDERPVTRPIQYWTPDGFNTWVGDVVVGVFRDRLHLFYLHDRRHHGSNDGAGAHRFEHLSTADLVHWVEHPTAVPIEQWWQTIGTGTPFVWNDRLHLAYGLHTTRFMPREETCEDAMQAYFRDHGTMGDFAFGELPGYPIGGSYAVSDDGVHFRLSRRLFHTAQNPSVYNRPDGLLGCVNSYGGHHGMYVSDHVGDWRLDDPDIPIDGDCPCAFEWHGHHYLLQGFVFMAYNPDGRVGGWVDWSRTGDDVYDGLSVPMVAPWCGDRRIMAGWIGHPCGWGGWLAFHELVAFPDGRLGVKWLPETPPPGDIFAFARRPGESLRLVFVAEGDGAAVEFRLDAEERRAQWADSPAVPTGTPPADIPPAPRQKTQAELVASVKDLWRDRFLFPFGAGQYAVQNIRGLDEPFTVRVAACYDAKSGCTLFDAEIAGTRAMICRRRGRFLPPVEIPNRM